METNNNKLPNRKASTARKKDIPSPGPLVLISFCLECLHLALPLSVSFYLSYAIPQLSKQNSQAFVLVTVCFVIGVILAYFLAVWTRIRLESQMRQLTAARQIHYGLEILERPLRPDLGSWRERAIHDLSQLVCFRYQKLPQAIAGFLFALASFALQLAKVPLSIALLFAALALLLLLPAIIEKSWAEKNYEDTSDIEAEIDKVYFEANQGLDLVKTEALSQDVIKRVQKLDKDYLTIGYRAERTGSTEDLIANSIRQLLTWGSLFLLFFLVSRDRLLLSDLPALFVTIQVYYQAMQDSFSGLTEFFVSRKRQERLEELLVQAGPPAFSAAAELGGDRLEYGLPKTSGLAAQTAPVLASSHLSLRRADRHFIWPDIQIRPGEKYRLQGPNGSGKSTLLRVLASMEPDFQGAVALPCSTEASSCNGIQAPALFLQTTPRLSLTGEEFLAKIRPEEAEKMQVLLQNFYPAQKWDLLAPAKIDSYSGGERQIFFLAYCLAQEAPLYLLDEPDDQLDQKMVEALEAYLDSISAAVLIISHHADFCAHWPVISMNLAEGTTNA